MNKTKILETSLVLTTAFLVFYLITDRNYLLYISLGFGLTGIFVKPLAKWIAILWFKLAEILSFIVSKIIFGALFFLLLFPVAAFYRIFNKDKIKLKNSYSSMWNIKNHKYTSRDLENIW